MQAVRIGTCSPGHRAMPPQASQPTAAASRLVVRRRHTLCCVSCPCIHEPCHAQPIVPAAGALLQSVAPSDAGKGPPAVLTSAGWPAATADAAAGTCGDGVCGGGGGVLVAHVCVSLSLVVGHAQLRAARTALQQAAVTAVPWNLPFGWLVGLGQQQRNSHGRAVSSWRPSSGPPG